MKVVVDIDKLFKEWRIDSEEYAKLKGASVKETSSLAFNILTGFGVIATAEGNREEDPAP